MKTFFSAIAVIAALQATPSLAQDAVFDAAAVTAACQSGGESCLAAVQAAVAAIEASGGDATAPAPRSSRGPSSLLLELARSAPAATLAVFAQAMGAISDASTDPTQKAALNVLASDLNAGNVPATSPFGAVDGLSTN